MELKTTTVSITKVSAVLCHLFGFIILFILVYPFSVSPSLVQLDEFFSTFLANVNVQKAAMDRISRLEFLSARSAQIYWVFTI